MNIREEKSLRGWVFAFGDGEGDDLGGFVACLIYERRFVMDFFDSF